MGLLIYETSVLGIPSASFLYEGIKIKGITGIDNSRSGGQPLSLTINLTIEKVTPITITAELGEATTASLLAVKTVNEYISGQRNLGNDVNQFINQFNVKPTK